MFHNVQPSMTYYKQQKVARHLSPMHFDFKQAQIEMCCGSSTETHPISVPHHITAAAESHKQVQHSNALSPRNTIEVSSFTEYVIIDELIHLCDAE